MGLCVQLHLNLWSRDTNDHQLSSDLQAVSTECLIFPCDAHLALNVYGDITKENEAWREVAEIVGVSGEGTYLAQVAR